MPRGLRNKKERNPLNFRGDSLALYLRLWEKITFEPGHFNSFSLRQNLTSEKEIDKMFTQAIAAGATTAKEPQKLFWGGYSGYFKNPDGHL